MMQTSTISVKSYIAGFPPEIKKRLNQVYAIIKKAAPKAEESIGYGMPTFKLNGTNLIHFAGYTKHLGLYPTPTGISAFKKELSKFKNSKGAVQFLHSEPLPLPLITKIVKFRVQSLKK